MTFSSRQPPEALYTAIKDTPDGGKLGLPPLKLVSLMLATACLPDTPANAKYLEVALPYAERQNAQSIASGIFVGLGHLRSNFESVSTVEYGQTLVDLVGKLTKSGIVPESLADFRTREKLTQAISRLSEAVVDFGQQILRNFGVLSNRAELTGLYKSMYFSGLGDKAERYNDIDIQLTDLARRPKA